MAHMQLHELVVVRRVRHREAAPRAVLQEDVDVLAGEEHQALVRRELQIDDHGVVRGALQFLHARGELPHLDIARFAHFAGLDRHVGQRLRLAKERVALLALLRGERLFRIPAVVDSAIDELSLAAAACAVAAAVWEHEACVERRLQDRRAVLRRKPVAGVAYRDLMRHRCAGENPFVENLLIIGCGDVARRALPAWGVRQRVAAVVRSPNPALDAADVEQMVGDLDDAASLVALCGRARGIVHLAPPAGTGALDTRTRSLLAALAPRGRGAMLPRRFVYLSTSGVYGDCAGEWVDETRPPSPRSERALRRLDAERALGDWGERNKVEIVILRVPGIYAADRLPLERLARGTPALRPEEDVYTNHIHADDLAGILVTALESTRARGVYNASDDGPMKMGDFFDFVADRTGLARPPRISREEAARLLPPELLSFMSESRRLSNRRLKAELGVRLRYSTVRDGVPGIKETA